MAANLSFAIQAVNDADATLRQVRQQLGDVADTADRGKGPLGAMGGALGNVAQIAGGFVLGQGLLQLPGLMGGAIDLASDFAESQSKVRVVFGESSGAVEEFAKNASRNLGLAQGKALEATGTFGNFLQSMGLLRPAAADMSMDMVTLAGDLASFNNANPEEVLTALRSGLSGEAEPMKRFGVALNETAVKAKAAELGLGGLSGELTESEKIQARYAIIMEQTAMAQGDFARTSDGLANKQRIQAAQMEDLKVKVGNVLLPIKLLATEGLLKLVEVGSRLADIITVALTPAFNSVKDAVGSFFYTLRTGFTEDEGTKIEQLALFLRNDLLPALQEIGTFLIDRVLPHLIEWYEIQYKIAVEVLQNLLLPALVQLKQNFDAVWPVIEAHVLPVLKSLGEFLLDHKEIIIAVAAAILLLTNPWLAVAAAIVVVLAYQDDIEAFFRSIVTKAQELIDKFQEIPIIGEIFTATFEAIRIYVETWFTVVKTLVETQIKIVVNIIQAVIAIFKGDWDRVWNEIKDSLGLILTAAVTIAKTLLDGLVEYFLTLGPRIIAAIGDAGTLLYDVGVKLIGGLKTGAESMIAQLVLFFTGLPGQISSWIGDLYKFGLELMGKLARGLVDGTAGAITDAISGLASKLDPRNIDIPGLSPLLNAFQHAGALTMEHLALGIKENKTALESALTGTGNMISSVLIGSVGSSGTSNIITAAQGLIDSGANLSQKQGTWTPLEVLARWIKSHPGQTPPKHLIDAAYESKFLGLGTLPTPAMPFAPIATPTMPLPPPRDTTGGGGIQVVINAPNALSVDGAAVEQAVRVALPEIKRQLNTSGATLGIA